MIKEISTCACPAGKKGLVTTVLYESNKINYDCSFGSRESGWNKCECGSDIAIYCRDNSDISTRVKIYLRNFITSFL